MFIIKLIIIIRQPYEFQNISLFLFGIYETFPRIIFCDRIKERVIQIEKFFMKFEKLKIRYYLFSHNVPESAKNGIFGEGDATFGTTGS